MSENGAQSRPAGLRNTNVGFQEEPPLRSTTLNVLSWSTAAALVLKADRGYNRRLSGHLRVLRSSLIPDIYSGP